MRFGELTQRALVALGTLDRRDSIGIQRIAGRRASIACDITRSPLEFVETIVAAPAPRSAHLARLLSMRLRTSVVCSRTASSAAVALIGLRLQPALDAAPGLRRVGRFDSSSSRDRASLAHGETLSRFRYSVHAVLASAVNDSADAASARLNHASFNDGSNRRARSAAARARGRSSGRRPSRARSSCTAATSLKYRAFAGCSRDAARSDCAASS